jgi:hypothetical protein
MIKIYGFLMIALLSITALAQNKPAPEAKVQDTMMMSMKGHAFCDPQRDMQKGCYAPMHGMACFGGSCMGQNAFHRRPMVLRAFFMILAAGILFCAAINILLTFFVIMDMKKLERFHGILIPVVLITGIPGAIIYALIRLGDNFSLAEDKKS